MRLERNSLIAVILLVLAGCSANRHARQADNEYDATDSVAMPLLHADEYESSGRNYEYESAPSDDETPGPYGTPVPPPAPMQEPVPAPPAIGVSRIKSVSWLRSLGGKSERDNGGDNACGAGCSTGQQSILPPEYFSERCVTPPRTAAVPNPRCREKTTLVKVMQGWNLRAKTRQPERIQPSLNCGQPIACVPGAITPEGGNSSPKRRKTAPVVKRSVGGAAVDPGTAPHGKQGGNPSDPLKANRGVDHSAAGDQRPSPDDLLDLPSKQETPAGGQTPQNVPDVPTTQPTPALPMAEPSPTPAIQDAAPSPVVPQQTTPDSVKQIVRPPMWPRLGSAAATSSEVPVSNPANPDDSSLPTIQPGRRI